MIGWHHLDVIMEAKDTAVIISTQISAAGQMVASAASEVLWTSGGILIYSGDRLYTLANRAVVWTEAYTPQAAEFFRGFCAGATPGEMPPGENIWQLRGICVGEITEEIIVPAGKGIYDEFRFWWQSRRQGQTP